MKGRQWSRNVRCGALSICLLALLFGSAGSARPPSATKGVQGQGKRGRGLPLEPERRIEFRTEEGTWMSLDVSPDGKMIVFDLLGDLYTLPIEGGKAQQLTHGMGFDSQPRFSPDGTRITFVSDRGGAENLWITGSDGSAAKPVTNDQHSLFVSPAWTPDGAYVIVSRTRSTGGGYELWMYHVEGGSGVQITKVGPTPETRADQRHNALGPVASPDGRYIYYARRIGSGVLNVTFPLWQIARRDRTTGVEDVLTQAGGSAMRPVLSPGGSKLAYGTRHEGQTGLRLRDLVTGEDRWLQYPVQRDDQESRATRDLLPGYAFTPDGEEIVASYGGRIHRISVVTGEDRIIPFTADVSVDLGPLLDFPARVDQGPVKVRVIQDPSESPAGDRLAFSALARLYVMKIPEGAPQEVTSGEFPEYQPAWSPDGQWLAYVTWTPEGGHLWKVRADGDGGPQRLTRYEAFYREPVWSPDGSRIVVLRAPRRARLEKPYKYYGPTHGLELIWVPAAGGEETIIAPARGADQPHFTDEPNRVYMYSSDGLHSMRLDGTDRRTHVKIVGKGPRPEPNPAQGVRLSPDGRWALALVANQLYLVAVPQVGGQAPKINIDSATVPVKKLTDIGADYFAWAGGGSMISWSIGASFFRQALDTVSFGSTENTAEQTNIDHGDVSQSKQRGALGPSVEEIEVIIQRPRHRPHGTIVLRGAQVITMRGDELIPDADIVVTDNRIARVGRRGTVRIPEGATIIDVTGTTIIPGMIDTHAHWREVHRGVLDSPSWRLLANLAYGITSGRDPQTFTNDIFTYQDMVDIGEAIGPRAFSTGPGIFFNSDLHSLEDAKQVVTRFKKYYRTKTVKSYVIGNRKQRQWMVEACRALEMMPTTEGARDLKLDLTHVIDGFSGNEHGLPIVPLSRDVVELVARSGLTYTPTLLVAYGGPQAEAYFYQTTEVHDDSKVRRFIPHYLLDAVARRRMWFREDEHIYSELASAAAKIIRAGGRVGIGSHGQLQGISFHWEMWALSSGGVTNMEVLRAATLHGAEAIGYAQDLGSIESGKLADLVVLSGDPLLDIRNTDSILYVMKNGVLYEGDTLDERWPEQKPLEPLWWWDDQP